MPTAPKGVHETPLSLEVLTGLSRYLTNGICLFGVYLSLNSQCLALSKEKKNGTTLQVPIKYHLLQKAFLLILW